MDASTASVAEALPPSWVAAAKPVSVMPATAALVMLAPFTMLSGSLAVSEDDAAELKEQPDPGPTPEEEVFRKAEIGRVRSAIEAIPEPFREAIILRDLEDLSYAEIAEVTGVPIGTVMSRLARGRSMLAKEVLPASKATSEQSRSVK